MGDKSQSHFAGEKKENMVQIKPNSQNYLCLLNNINPYSPLWLEYKENSQVKENPKNGE